MFSSSQCLERSRRHLSPSLWRRTATQAMLPGSGLEGLVRFLQRRTAQWTNTRPELEGTSMKALQMKTMKRANVGLALKNTVAAVHDIWLMHAVLSCWPTSSMFKWSLSYRWSCEQCNSLTSSLNCQVFLLLIAVWNVVVYFVSILASFFTFVLDSHKTAAGFRSGDASKGSTMKWCSSSVPLFMVLLRTTNQRLLSSLE